MKKISLITISLLIFVFAISCASAADHNVDMTNNTAIDNTIDIADAQNVDFNISAEDNSSSTIEPLENDTNISSELNITGPKIHSGELNITGPKPHDIEIPGPKIQVNENSNTKTDSIEKTDSIDGLEMAEIAIGAAGIVTVTPILIATSAVMYIGELFDWW